MHFEPPPPPPPLPLPPAAPKTKAQLAKEAAETVRTDLIKSMNASLATVMSVFRSMDKDRSNSIDRAEWRKGVVGLLGDKYSTKTLNEVFDVFDADRSGRLSYDEMKRQLQETPEEIEARKARAKAKAAGREEPGAGASQPPRPLPPQGAVPSRGAAATPRGQGGAADLPQLMDSLLQEALAASGPRPAGGGGAGAATPQVACSRFAHTEEGVEYGATPAHGARPEASTAGAEQVQSASQCAVASLTQPSPVPREREAQAELRYQQPPPAGPQPPAHSHATAAEAMGCATCSQIQAEYSQHDAWVESLKASAEAVLAGSRFAEAGRTPADPVQQTPRPPASTPHDVGFTPRSAAPPSSRPPPSAEELRELELLGLDPGLVAQLRAQADVGRSSGERLDSSGSGGRGSEDSAGLGSLRLSGLDTGLREQLRQQARAARDLALAEESSPSLYSPEPPYSSPLPSSAVAGSAARRSCGSDASISSEYRDYRGASGAAPGARPPPELSGLGEASSSREQQSTFESGTAGGSACPTCSFLQEEYAEHDAWVESLKASAEAVLATHQKARQELSELLPGSDSSGGSDGA